MRARWAFVSVWLTAWLTGCAGAVADAAADPWRAVRTPTINYADVNAPRRGRFLVATDQVVGPFFYHTVVLLLSHDPDGSIGLVINRPTELPASALLPSVDEVQQRDDPAHFGGPVEPNRMMVLIESESPPDEALQIVGQVYASRSLETLQALFKRVGPDLRFRAYVGYAGWGPGQLDAEIAAGDWLVDSADAKAIFETPAIEIWPEFIRRNSGVQARRWRGPLRGAPEADISGARSS